MTARFGAGVVDSVEMSDVESRLAAPTDSRGRVVSIFVGAVLLPSIALSVLSFNAVPKHAENLKISLKAQAQKMLYYVEQDLETAARARALEAARAVGTEALLEGRPRVVRAALREGRPRGPPLRLAASRGLVPGGRRGVERPGQRRRGGAARRPGRLRPAGHGGGRRTRCP